MAEPYMNDLPGQQWHTDEEFMRQAVNEAIAALDTEDVPVGAVVVYQGRIIGRGRNQREQLKDPTAHAEMVALTAAASELGSWRLNGCTIYVTLEPCTMCAGALVLARIDRLVYGADDPKAGACGSVYNIVEEGRLNHVVQVQRGVMAADAADLLRTFFAQQRAKGKK
ncbi:MAG TPA: tRNA adenosine(34) deaminase TadA [Phycisphaerae bacterium]|nr:tRNA adenosine(34) deaminase TadA [Phycisphaerae bacterium]HOJ75446.1 tRNA adenosine(34) deaminase TadA [Phycisphaerae bacterium]HOM52246.1 tRNA adenosine(34) deaminase TadA [Phycisphaerae bacterium]HON65854.1 tRNA adenosine(34) deaminase TadA [Phycisphaerae bacterium]HOQ84140.1 tRNA adenosine(34) deaminase TadA [Phycisphaerae bacterium]